MALDNINTVTARVNDLYKKLAEQDKDVLDVDKNCIDLKARVDKLEKALAELKAAVDNKKDKKTAEQESTAQSAEYKKFADKQVKLAQEVSDAIALKQRFAVVEMNIKKLEESVTKLEKA